MVRSNKLLFLALVTLVAVVAAVITARNNAPTTTRAREIMFPELKDKINDISRIKIQGSKDSLTLLKDGGSWVVQEADNYLALFSKIKQTVIAVADLKFNSAKTRNPELYSKLGVEDPDKEDSESKLLNLYDAQNQLLASIIVGKQRLSNAASARPGLYIRLPGQAQAILVDGDLDVSTKASEWIEVELMNISPDRIREMNVSQSSGNDYQLSRIESSGDLVLADIPAGKEVQSAYVLNRMEEVLENIRIDNVKSITGFDFPEELTEVSIKTFDGLTATIHSAVVDETNYAKFDFSYVEPQQAEEEDDKDAAANSSEDVADEDATANSSESAADEDATTDKLEEVAKEVERLKQKTSGWVYVIPNYKFELFSRKLDDLIKDIEAEAEQESPN